MNGGKSAAGKAGQYKTVYQPATETIAWLV